MASGEEFEWAARWALGRDTGLSSEAMVRHALWGDEIDWWPGDMSDLVRCERAYASAPESLRQKMRPTLGQFRERVARRERGL